MILSRGYTVVAEMITELIRFEPEICICNGKVIGIPERICICSERFSAEIRSVSVMEINSSGSAILYL